ncbi:hypothetical protein LZ24_01650 [Desulfobotulus alkaliphilus]|uniref:Uncharacterized protein n=1 Tax=Desulfobotulus alkaliphilus TaxID=622671 RepID=A0A562RTR0_9BACT|nr:hypothetical protein [Desulfobotulus alkaliphilus]TWI72243.1 hypothetical protein LZ24_01650 [Desulfobotulus alkaliphilus]
MSQSVTVHATIDVSPETLASLVRHAKRLAGEQGKKADPAETLNQMVSLFLAKNDFESFVDDPANYS